MRNQLPTGIDREAWIAAFEGMTPKARRWAFIAAKMAEKKKNFTDIAKRHRLSTWYTSACAQGKDGYGLTLRIVEALEADLGIDLGPFLSPDEVRKINRTKAEPTAKSETATEEEAI